MFEQRAYLAGLPSIRLHDLRHGVATLLHAVGHDMKVVQETLGLSSITIAADTYTMNRAADTGLRAQLEALAVRSCRTAKPRS